MCFSTTVFQLTVNEEDVDRVGRGTRFAITAPCVLIYLFVYRTEHCFRRTVNYNFKQFLRGQYLLDASNAVTSHKSALSIVIAEPNHRRPYITAFFTVRIHNCLKIPASGTYSRRKLAGNSLWLICKNKSPVPGRHLQIDVTVANW